MNLSEMDLEDAIKEAERRGDELRKLEARNKRRRAKGRKPLPDIQEKLDMQVLKKRYRTGDPTVLAGEDAMKLFEIRKAQMSDEEDELDELDEDIQENSVSIAQKAPATTGDASSLKSSSAERAVRQAEAARRVEDMKNGRIDHDGNWTDGQKLEGGDETVISMQNSILKDGSNDPGDGKRDVMDESKTDFMPSFQAGKRASVKDMISALEYFRKDLYERLRVSFDGIEKSMSDLQGRVSEIVTSSSREDSVLEEPGPDVEPGFGELLSKKTPVSFNVGGTTMTFDAICVFHAPPCITIVSKIGSAKITPKPGARILLSYSMDGDEYVEDPVTYLGTRFDLPMFGLSFVGFIRDAEADVMDADAGISEQEGEYGA